RSEEEGRRSLEIIDQESRRLTHLVENLLHFSRSERQVTRLSPARAPLAPLVQEALEGFAPLAGARGVRLRSELAEGVVAPVDAEAFRQMLLNLLDNAVNYGPPGQVVTVGLAAGDQRARIGVDDQGPGIPRPTASACGTASGDSSETGARPSPVPASGSRWCASWWRCTAGAPGRRMGRTARSPPADAACGSSSSCRSSPPPAWRDRAMVPPACRHDAHPRGGRQPRPRL